MQNKC